MPSSRASRAVRRDVGTPMTSIRAPRLSLSDSATKKWATVDPVPNPKRIPLSTSWAAARPTSLFSESASAK